MDNRPDSVDNSGPMWRIRRLDEVEAGSFQSISKDLPALDPHSSSPSAIASSNRPASSTQKPTSSTVDLSVAAQRTHSLHTIITVMTR